MLEIIIGFFVFCIILSSLNNFAATCRGSGKNRFSSELSFASVAPCVELELSVPSEKFRMLVVFALHFGHGFFSKLALLLNPLQFGIK